MPRNPDFERRRRIEAGKPHCLKCGRLIHESDTGDYCTWCWIVIDFTGG
ncbi:hypothetical protein SEA_SAINTS25_39 [Mycobacterium phage Saints25]|nr:hypothetical protein PBI_PAT3_37 [Mycobacterium phage Pat3]QDF17653.1 hypothetical protein SEA_CHOTABHAI_38 [Mycobacterium phage ChotaBhai]WNO26122.1 hypothetical protein SEA_SAINTS25_39 [Mycobacterium phage Saints25]WNO28484.1 hypothetical protein SEA_HIGHBURY_39 [Mycobacterium phage Highbury]